MDMKDLLCQEKRLALALDYEKSGKWSDAEDEGLRILEYLKKKFRCEKDSDTCEKFLPHVMMFPHISVDCRDLLQNTVEMLLSCAVKRKSEQHPEVYDRLIQICQEFIPCISLFKEGTSRKMHALFANQLWLCTTFLIQEVFPFQNCLVAEYYKTVMACIAETSDIMSKVQEDAHKFVETMCTDLLAVQFGTCKDIIDRTLVMLVCFVDKVGVKYIRKSFFGLITACVNKSHMGNSICVRPISDVQKLISCLPQTETIFFEKSENLILLYLRALNFLCQPFRKLVCEEGQEPVNDEVKGAVSSAQEKIYDVFLYLQNADDVHVEGVDCISILYVALAPFTILAHEGDCMQSVQMLNYAITSKWIQHDLLSEFSGVLLAISRRCLQPPKAIEVLKLHCTATWIMFQCKLEEKVDPSNDSLKFFVEWSNGMANLLSLLDQSEAQRAIKQSLKQWAEHLFESLPGPLSLVQRWVQIQMAIKRELNVNDEDIPVLGTMFSSHKEAKKKILQQEAFAYAALSEGSTKEYMWTKIIHLLDDDRHNLPITWLEEAKHLRLCGAKGRVCSIAYLGQVVYSLNLRKRRQGSHACHQLAWAHCLRALCALEFGCDLKEVFEDIKSALAEWLRGIPTSDDFVSGNTLMLLYNIIDLLTIKGHMKFHKDIYTILIMIYDKKQVPSEKCFAKLWQYRRSSHPLCASAVSEALMDLPSSVGDVNSVKFWIKCLQEPLLVGFKNNFSFPLSNICGGRPKRAFLSDFTVDKVKTVASALLSPVSSSEDSTMSCGVMQNQYIAGYLYYDLCERLGSDGQLFEALTYAKQAHALRLKLYENKFPWPVEKQDEIYMGNTLFCTSVASEMWSFETRPCDLEKVCNLTPWNVLQCFLESILQVAGIYEIMGDTAVAVRLLELGQHISGLHELRLFKIVFSSALGKLFCKLKYWDLAERKLKYAKQHLEESGEISCSKCRLLMEATVEKNLCQLLQNKFLNDRRTSMELVSRYRSALVTLHSTEWKNKVSCPTNPKHVSSKYSFRENAAADSLEQDLKGCVLSVAAGVACMCKGTQCWHCHTANIMGSQSVKSLIMWKWELIRRRICLKMFRGLGKCLENQGQIHRTHDIISQSISILVGSNTFVCATNSRFLHDFMGKEIAQTVISSDCFQLNLYDLMGKEIPEDAGDVLRVDRAKILYNLCWSSLRHRLNKTCSCNSNGCWLIKVPIPKLVSWLMLAFVLSRGVPRLFQKVSKLVALICSLSPLTEIFSPLSLYCKDPGVRHWACYFHQASIGAIYNYQLFTEGSEGLAPKSILDLKKFIKQFFKCLPCTTVLCVSLYGSPYTIFIQELLKLERIAPAWIHLSRLNSTSEPINILLAVVSVSTDVTHSGQSDDRLRLSTVVDNVAPEFRWIMESIVKAFSADKVTDELVQNVQKIDAQFSEFLRKLQDSLFGNLQFMLLGEEWPNSEDPGVEVENLVGDLKSSSKIDDSLLKVVLVGIKLRYIRSEKQVREFYNKEGCHVIVDSVVNDAGEVGSEVSDHEYNGLKPIILVLDNELQILPLESLPILRNQEVYRMPSLWTTCARYKTDYKIDLLNGFYLFNPDGDLYSEHQVQHLCRENGLEGRVGSAFPTAEWAAKLASHDLFIYMGHGSGSQYIAQDEIRRVQNCAAVILMGCQSGDLSEETVLSYLHAGSPFIVASLWDMATCDGDDFLLALLKSWFKEKENVASDRNRKIGSFMCHARQNCFLKYSSGASMNHWTTERYSWL